MLLGECKYSSHPKGLAVLNDLHERLAFIPHADEYSTRFAIFSRSGFDKHLIEYAGEHEDVSLYSLDDISVI